MSHVSERIVTSLRYLESAGMSVDQLSQLHHFSLRGRTVSFSRGFRYFGVNKELRENNIRYAERLAFVANAHKLGEGPLNALVRQALARWPLKGD